MEFWFEFFNIHMNEKIITCHDCHGFKWKNINIYPILIAFLYNSMPFLAHCIVSTPIVDLTLIKISLLSLKQLKQCDNAMCTTYSRP
jgi:hypothetical protein